MRVVAAVIFNANDEVLLAQRPPGKHLAGLWEFPGGKIELGESEIEALQRELKEELFLEVDQPQKLGEFAHQYPNQNIVLIAYKVFAINEPKTSDQVQVFKWCNLESIDLSTLAAADIPIYQKLISEPT